jgi:hypothetical protein
MNEFQRSLLNANPKLSRFDPLPRVLFHDDFDEGINGWSTLIGNYEGSLDSILPGYRDLRPAQLSNLTMWDTGTAGSMEGTYALKLATRPKAGHMAVNIKRQTWRVRGKIQLECYFTYKAEATELSLGELDVRAFGVLFDIQDQQRRWMPHLRYLNALNGKPAAGSETNHKTRAKPAGKWQFKTQTEDFADIGNSGKTVSHWHLSPNNWQDVPGGEQILCYNEIATKMNWCYLKVGLDLEQRTFTHFQCNDQTFRAEDIGLINFPAMANLECMLNTAFWVETDTDKRSFLYLDSILLSADMQE